MLVQRYKILSGFFFLDAHSQTSLNPLPSYPKLLFDWTGVGLGIQSVHVIVHRTELIGRNGGVSAKTRLQNGIMDKDILLLKEQNVQLKCFSNQPSNYFS